MHPALTILTPIGIAHTGLFPRARASVEAQTIPTLHLFKVDTEQRGAGATRNALLDQVTTHLVSFLDADDTFEPHYAEHTIAAWKPNLYIYTDWYQDGHPVRAYPFCEGKFHLVASVYATEDVRRVGGFDETLPACEDTDLALKLMASGVCGRRVPIPLVHYNAHGGRADGIHVSGKVDELLTSINMRYTRESVMGCCGDEGVTNNTPIGDHQEGDVYAQAQWGGNRTEMGRATGRRYKRGSYPQFYWVDPRDAAARPDHWKVYPHPDTDVTGNEPSLPNPLRGVAGLQAQMLGANLLTVAPPSPLPHPSLMEVHPLPNFRKVKRLAGALKLPTFVMPRRDYPSYSDLWKLVDLGGYEVVYQDEIDLSDPNQTYIFAAPDGIPDCTGAKARTIFWQLEYVGEYTNQTNKDTVGETWSSDPADAKRTGARFVLMGSHKGLNPAHDTPKPEAKYDLLMLAYLTDRRRVIKDALSDYSWPEVDYPGHDTAERHDQLWHSRLMLHVHQHDTPALAPLRYALAAAYKLPVLVETTSMEDWPYDRTMYMDDYKHIPQLVRGLVNPSHAIESGESLYSYLCIEHPFEQCVDRAIADGAAPVVKPKNKGGRPRKVKK